MPIGVPSPAAPNWRLVVIADVVRRVVSLSGLDRLVSVYPTLEAAIAGADCPEVPGEPAPRRPHGRTRPATRSGQRPHSGRTAVSTVMPRSCQHLRQQGQLASCRLDRAISPGDKSLPPAADISSGRLEVSRSANVAISKTMTVPIRALSTPPQSKMLVSPIPKPTVK